MSTERKIQEYLHFYLGCEVMTPDGIGWLAAVRRDRRKMDGLLLDNRVDVHFKKIIETTNSVDQPGKKRNYGSYYIMSEDYIPIDAPNGSEPEFTILGGVKPILRPLSDMTEEEKAQSDKFNSLSNFELAEWFRYLLSRGFDLFDLIPDRLAIDKTTLKP